MNILIVSSFLPYPLFSGGNVRLYNLLKYLSSKHTVTLVCEKRPGQSQKERVEIEKLGVKVLTVNRKKQWSVYNILRSGFSTQPFLLVGHHLPEMTQVIQNELKTKTYDLIHVETFYVLQNLPKTTLPVLLVEHNIEYLVYKRFAEKAPLFLKPLLNLDVLKIKKAEENAWRKAKKVVTVSQEDKRSIGREDTEVIANGVDLAKFKLKKMQDMKDQKKYKILYIGDYKWIQNTDAAKYIVSEVWPRLLQILESHVLKTEMKLWIVGRNMPQSLKDLGRNDESIIFDDNNRMETQDIFSEASVLLSPKRVGGGTSYKILEAMAVGTPVITTPLGLEGLSIKEEQDVLVANDAKELAEQVIRVLSDQNLYESLSENGRKRVEEQYDWQAIGKKLEEVYQSLV